MAKILIIDDEENILKSLKSALDRRQHEADTAASYAEGLEKSKSPFDIIFLDIMLGDGNGIDLLKHILSRNRQQIIVMISGHADIDMAVSAIRAGAYDFIEKPVSLDRVLVTISNATKTNKLRSEKGRLSDLIYGEFIGASKPVVELKENIARSASRASRFLILGENGTGKELVANMIHRAGSKCDGSFVTVNCAALPSELVESELFGHVKGAFTGAHANRNGKFLEADHGSIFLDEISEMPLEAQAKVLRAIETKQISPVGSDKSIPVDCNIIAASNRDLEKMIEENKFRQDLYYRLNVVLLHLPALRERISDLGLLCTYFLNKFAYETGNNHKTMNSEAMDFLRSYNFPGNVRELKNIMERLNIYCDNPVINLKDIKPLLPHSVNITSKSLKEAVSNFEQDYIKSIIDQNEGNMSSTARQLGIERSHLYKKINKFKKK